MTLVVLDTAADNAILQSLISRIDSGAGAGKLKFLNSSGSVVATGTLSKPSFSNPANGVCALPGAVDCPLTEDATVTHFVFTNSEDVQIVKGDVSDNVGDGDIKLSRITYNSGEVIRVVTYSMTSP